MSKVYIVADESHCCGYDYIAVFEKRADAKAAVKRGIGKEIIEFDVFPRGDTSLRTHEYWQVCGVVRKDGTIGRWQPMRHPSVSVDPPNIPEPWVFREISGWGRPWFTDNFEVRVSARTQAEAEHAFHEKCAEVTRAINEGRDPLKP